MSTKASFPLLPATLAANRLPQEVGQEDKLTCYTDQLKDIIQDLYELMVQTTSYGNVGQGVSSKDVLQNTVSVTTPLTQHTPPTHYRAQLIFSSTHLHASLTQLHASASTPSATPIRVPPELIQYVDAGRNPDIYTREFVELARRGNQLMKGKKQAFGSFRDILAREMASALPEVKGDVETVVRETGGDVGKLYEPAAAETGGA
jgi:mediator of RNA polymerase II transcription subunit 10